MTALDSKTAAGCLTALRVVRELRSRIASELAIAGTDLSAGSDIADCVENVRSWLDDGEATLRDAMRSAEAELRSADEAQYERRIAPHAA